MLPGGSSDGYQARAGCYRRRPKPVSQTYSEHAGDPARSRTSSPPCASNHMLLSDVVQRREAVEAAEMARGVKPTRSEREYVAA